MNVSNMNDKEKEDALELIMFLKEKCDGTFKGRAYAYGRKQQEGY